MSKVMYRFYLVATFIVCFLLVTISTYATHIRAGEITAEVIDQFNLTYRFTFTGFRDTGSPIPFGTGIFRFGDGRFRENDFQVGIEPAGNGIEQVTFTVVHTYQAPAEYTISYEEENRNADIINMTNSVGTQFYVETIIRIDPAFGFNNTPTLTVPPIDFAAVGTLFIHNPGAEDIEGDSLSYRFTIPKSAAGNDVIGYRELNHPDFYTNFSRGNEEQNNTPTLTLNPISGDLIWDAPGDASVGSGEIREYNVAFVVVEWRKFAGEYFPISQTTRDMQIIVVETDNERPNLTVPEDICVEAGTFIQEIMTADDPDRHPVKIEGFGGPFEINQPAFMDPDPAVFGGPPNVATFNWNTVCGHIRERPYEVQFKVTDDPPEGPSLVNFETFKVTVVGPPPTGLQTQVQPGKSIDINWDEYSCSGADRMEIWRRVGDFPIEAENCVIGMPPNTGYQLIKVQGIDTTSFLDNNFGQGLSAGAKYCYRLVARFPEPTGGFSYVSTEACDSILIDVPVITNVDVTQTSSSDGIINIAWSPPIEIDQSIYPPDYTYDVFRSIRGADTFVAIASQTLDTTFTDTGLNTLNESYEYFVRFYDSGNVLVDSSKSASSIRLNLRPLVKSIQVNWEAEVPWSLRVPEFPLHTVYRDQVLDDFPDSLVEIAMVDVLGSPFTYLDNGEINNTPLEEETEYCYYVETRGSYDNPLLPSPLINRSQISCAEPNDTIPPCAPPSVFLNDNFDCRASLASKSCNAAAFSNSIQWTIDTEPDCDDDIQSYNIFFSSTGLEEDYVLIESVSATSFIHENLPSYKGCYRVAAVDRSNNPSELTDAFCIDNCPVYELPNVFTPNGDGVNDTFTPRNSSGGSLIQGFSFEDCPRFIRKVIFTVTTRSGEQVYQYDSSENENNILIEWDGTNSAGQILGSGVYYYSADLTYDVLSISNNRGTVNGWVQILK